MLIDWTSFSIFNQDLKLEYFQNRIIKEFHNSVPSRVWTYPIREAVLLDLLDDVGLWDYSVVVCLSVAELRRRVLCIEELSEPYDPDELGDGIVDCLNDKIDCVDYDPFDKTLIIDFIQSENELSLKEIFTNMKKCAHQFLPHKNSCEIRCDEINDLREL